MSITLVVAMDEDDLIGKDGGLPWRLPADLAHFKRVTMGKPIIMGRKTWESLGRPLPGRENVVLTRDASYVAEGALVMHRLDDLLRYAAEKDEVCVIGGAEIYSLFLPHADRILLTRVHTRSEGDTHFSWSSDRTFEETERRERAADERNPHAMTFLTLEHRR